MQTFDISTCESCGKTRALLHAATWGVSGKLLGCNTYYECTPCSARENPRTDRSTLSPCSEKHVKASPK